jgi:TPR repeat protein
MNADMNKFLGMGDGVQLREAIRFYERGEMSSAAQLFIELAALNCPESCIYLSLMYRDGEGVPKDEVQGVRYKRQYVRILERLASSGDAAHEFQLGYVLQFGDGTAIDFPRAMSLFLSAAGKFCGEAQFHVSRIFAHGHCGQRVDPELERYWLSEATESEFPKALYYTALFLHHPSNSPTKAAQVVSQMRRSADLGCWQAKDFLSSIS